MKFLLIYLILFSTAFARTYDLSNRIGIGLGGGTSHPLGETEFNENAESDYMFNFHVRYQSSTQDALQFTYMHLDFEETDIDANVYDLMYLWRMYGGDRFTPILGIGAGVAQLNEIDKDNLKFQGRARAGFEYALTDDLFTSLVVDYLYINRMPDDDVDLPLGEMHVLAPQVNLTLFFGHDKEVSEKGKKKSNTRSSMDSDQDGIVDPKDKCPGTPLESKVNAYGCMEEEKAEVEVEVFFPTGKSTIDLNSHDSLDQLAAFLKEHPQTKAEIQGHTDNVGQKAMNRQLSADRANAVRVYLVEKQGISPTRLTSYGYGDEQPVADNSTADGRSKNRRVMAIISE